MDPTPPLPPLLDIMLPLTVVVAASLKPPYVRRCRAPLSVPTTTDTTPPPPTEEDEAAPCPAPPLSPPARPPRFRGTGNDDDAAASSNGLLPLAEWASRSDDVGDAKGLVPGEAGVPPPALEEADDPGAGDGYTLMERGDDEGRRSHTESMVAILLTCIIDTTVVIIELGIPTT